MSGSSFWKRYRSKMPGEPVSLRKSGNVKERKGVLGRALRDGGYQSLNHACLTAGVNPTVICRLLSGKDPLIGVRGEVNRSAVRLAEVLGETPERLFGFDMTWPAQLDIVIRIRPYDDRRRLLWELLDTLPKNYGTILRRRFEDRRTISEVAAEYGVSGERIRQIETKALRMLRHPCRRRFLQECRDDAVAASLFP